MPSTPLLGITQLTTSQSGKETTINDAVLALENATNAKLAISYAAVTTVLLSNTQATRNMLYVATGATEASLLRFPNTISAVNVNRVFAVYNDSGFQLTVKFNTGAGSTVIIPDGETRLIAAIDGADMIVAAQPGTAVTFLSLTDTPSAFTGEAGKMLVVNIAENALEFVDAALFPSYVGNAGKVLAVNGTADGVEWISVTPASTFLGLTDTPNDYTGQGGKLVAVNSGETAVEFIDAPDTEALEFIAAERWRIFVTEPGVEPEIGFGEVEFLDVDGIDLVGSGTEDASNFDTGFEPEFAFDGSIVSGTGWLTEASYVGDVWLEYDFGTPVTVRHVRLTPITDAEDYTPTEFKIQYYDGASWVDLGTRTPAPWVSSVAQTFKVNGVLPTRLYPFAGFFFTTPPTSSQVLFLHTVTDACTLADNFAGSLGDVGTNPAATFTMDVQVNGVSVGSIQISTGGVFTFTTTGGALSLVAGDTVKVLGPAVVGTAENVSVTFRATL